MKSIFLLGKELIHLFANLFPKTENWLAEQKHFWHILKTIFGKHLKDIFRNLIPRTNILHTSEQFT